jgi:hypothetical protein
VVTHVDGPRVVLVLGMNSTTGHEPRLRSSSPAISGSTKNRPEHYDTFAESRTNANETGLFNAYDARPAMIGLAGDVEGRRALDAGCGCERRFEGLHCRTTSSAARP